MSRKARARVSSSPAKCPCEAKHWGWKTISGVRSGYSDLANAGTLEIIPLEQPLTLFVWSKSRVVPVRLTDFSVTEEAFDPHLNPIRAKVSLGLRVLSVDDLGFAHPGGRMFMTYLGNKEQLASQAANVAISVLGLGGLP